MAAQRIRTSGLLGMMAAGLMLLAIAAPVRQVAQAQSLAAGPSAPLSSSAFFSLPWTPPAPAYRIRVDADGLYALNYTALAAAGLPVSTLDPRSFRMYYMGQEIRMRVIGEADGSFDPTDVALFYGRGIDSLFLDGVLPTNKYMNFNIYWLTYGCAIGPCAGPYGLRMAEPDGSGAGSVPGPFMSRERLWSNRNYLSAYPFEHDADHWWSYQITLGAPREFEFVISKMSAEAVPGTLRIRLLGYKDISHHLKVWLNNNLVIDGSPDWSMKTIYEATASVPREYFIEGADKINKIKVGLGTSDTVYLDWWDLFYPDTYIAEGDALAFNNAAAGAWRYAVTSFTTSDIEVYDVTDPFAPQRFVNTTVAPDGGAYTVSFGESASAAKRYLALTAAAWRTPVIEAATFLASVRQPADLRSSLNGADYILITHRDFWPQAEALALYRAYNFRVAVVDVQKIYDQFNGGLMSAEAIRDFLAYAHAHWVAPAPAYVLLMGDGTNDMRKYRSTTNTYIPPYLYLADPDLGETAADNRFVTFIGDDNIPDMHIGRFPVNDTAQAQAMVDKTIDYEIDCQCNDSWEKRTLFLADDLEEGGGNFYYFSDLIADSYADAPTNTVKLIPEDYSRQKEYLGVTCNIEGNPTDAAECRGNLVNALNPYTPANPTGGGALFVSFVGHSTKALWAVESMFNSTANSLLTNGPCLPIMLPMTCFEGSFFDYQTPEVLAEASVRLAADSVTGQTRGSVASFSPTGFGLVTGHDYLERGIMVAWFHEGKTRLGESITYAKQYLVDNGPEGKYLDLLDTFLLLGDPALQVKATEDACLGPTSVTLVDFGAQPEEQAVRLTWQTADESEVSGFNILRRLADGMNPAGPGFAAVNAEMLAAHLPGIAAGESYTFVDMAVDPGHVYQYKLEIVKLDGTREQFGFAEARPRGARLYLPLPVK